MKPNLYRQYLVDQLLELERRNTQWLFWDGQGEEPPKPEVEIDWQHLKLKLVPDQPENTFEGGQAVLIKHKSRLHVVILTNKDGLQVYEDGGENLPRRVQFGAVKAVIAEPDYWAICQKLGELRHARAQRADREDGAAGQPAVLRRHVPGAPGRRHRVPAGAQRP